MSGMRGRAVLLGGRINLVSGYKEPILLTGMTSHLCFMEYFTGDIGREIGLLTRPEKI